MVSEVKPGERPSFVSKFCLRQYITNILRLFLLLSQLSIFLLYSILKHGLFKTGFRYVDIWWPARHWSRHVHHHHRVASQIQYPCELPKIEQTFRSDYFEEGRQPRCEFFSLSFFFRWHQCPPPALVETPISRRQKRLLSSNPTELILPRFDGSRPFVFW